jgi:hypothetical protein
MKCVLARVNTAVLYGEHCIQVIHSLHPFDENCLLSLLPDDICNVKELQIFMYHIIQQSDSS